jgi:VanZ family protein
MRRRMKHIFTYVLVLWWAFLLLMTHLPKPPPLGPEMNDRTAHLVAYSTLALLVYLNLRARGRAPALAAMLTIAAVIVSGALDEWTQPLTGRTCDLLDWCADVAGAATICAAMAGAEWLVRRVPSRA